MGDPHSAIVLGELMDSLNQLDWLTPHARDQPGPGHGSRGAPARKMLPLRGRPIDWHIHPLTRRAIDSTRAHGISGSKGGMAAPGPATFRLITSDELGLLKGRPGVAPTNRGVWLTRQRLQHVRMGAHLVHMPSSTCSH